MSSTKLPCVLNRINVAGQQYHRMSDIISAMQSCEPVILYDSYKGQIMGIDMEDGSGKRFNLKIMTGFGDIKSVFVRAL